MSAKKPFLWVATFVLALALAGVGMFYKRATELTDEKAADRAKIAQDLERYDKKIEVAKGELDDLNARKDPYVRAAFERGYWLGIFKDLNDRMESDRLWITVLEPLSKGESVIASPDGASSVVPLSAAPVVEEQNPEGQAGRCDPHSRAVSGGSVETPPSVRKS